MAELEETPRDSMFHPDNVHQYTLLTLLQIKEFLGVIASNVSKDGLAELTYLEEEYHSKGRLLYPPPFLGEVTEE